MPKSDYLSVIRTDFKICCLCVLLRKILALNLQRASFILFTLTCQSFLFHPCVYTVEEQNSLQFLFFLHQKNKRTRRGSEYMSNNCSLTSFVVFFFNLHIFCPYIHVYIVASQKQSVIHQTILTVHKKLHPQIS